MSLPSNWPLLGAFLTASAVIAHFLWANFFNVRASLRRDFGDRVKQAKTRIIAEKYIPRLAGLYEELRKTGVESSDQAVMAELTAADFFGKIIDIYEQLRDRAALDDKLASLKRRGEQVAIWGGLFVVTLPLSYFVISWPVPAAANSFRTIAVTLWLVLLVFVPFCAAAWNLCMFWRERADLDETLDCVID